MRNRKNDTIVAPVTPAGRSSVGILRVSGAESKNIARAIIGQVPQPRYAHFSVFKNRQQEVIDQGIALYFPAPNSFTGEDVLELHAHGSPVILDCILHYILDLGARLARPGEFSERAFLNGKLDLIQAEAIADLINSASEAAAHSAMQSLQGMFSQQIDALLHMLIQLRTQVEANIDFSAEEIEVITISKTHAQIQQILQQLASIQAQAQQGRLLRDGVKVVIAGKPNVGKSSLLNYFTGHDSAIVTDIPGTTRDMLREAINLDGLPLHIVDTAGLRASDDQIEQAGISKTWREIELADWVLLMIDTDAVNLTAFQQVLDKVIIIRNKIDLSKQKPRVGKYQGKDIIYISVKTGAGLVGLRTYLKDKARYRPIESGSFIARRRHLDALARVKTELLHASEQNQFDLIAEDLRQAQNAINEITGAFCTDDLLGKIFADFCIGK